MTQANAFHHWRYYIRGRMVIVAVVLAFSFSVLDAFIDGWFHLGSGSFLMIPESAHEWWLRVPGIVLIFGFGIYAQATILWHKEVAMKLREISVIDPMTGIFNRRKFNEVIRHETVEHERYSRNMTVVMFDIDFFKQVNDDFGHAAGDQVLQQLVATVQKVLRESDYFFRWGGDEFLVLAPETGVQESLILAERLRIAVAGQQFGEVGEVTISIGFGQYIKGEDIDALLKRADDALYEAKHSGRNFVRATDSLRLVAK